MSFFKIILPTPLPPKKSRFIILSTKRTTYSPTPPRQRYPATCVFTVIGFIVPTSSYRALMSEKFVLSTPSSRIFLYQMFSYFKGGGGGLNRWAEIFQIIFLRMLPCQIARPARLDHGPLSMHVMCACKAASLAASIRRI